MSAYLPLFLRPIVARGNPNPPVAFTCLVNIINGAGGAGEERLGSRSCIGRPPVCATGEK